MHLMYVDESGDSGYPKGLGFPASGPTPFFVRVGVVLHGWHWRKVDQMIADFKRVRGLKWDDEIKATDLRRGKGVFANRTPQARRAFLLDLLDSLAREADLHLLVVAVDKRAVDRTQRPRFTNPSVRTLELLLERYNGFLREAQDKSGIVILDATEAKQDENLRYFQNYLLEFSDHIDQRRIVEGALFMPSHSSNLLQAADVCTNVAYRRFVKRDRNAEEFDRIKGLVRAEKCWP